MGNLPASGKLFEVIREFSNNGKSLNPTLSTTARQILNRNIGRKRTFLGLYNTSSTLNIRIGLGFVPTSTHLSIFLTDTAEQPSFFQQQGEGTFQGPVYAMSVSGAPVLTIIESWD